MQQSAQQQGERDGGAAKKAGERLTLSVQQPPLVEGGCNAVQTPL